MQPGKVQYLEGLRGIAAMQVVLLHFVSGFIPETAQHAWPPLRVLFDGHTAVYVFFLISGAVLTPSFARPGPFVAKMAKRVVRLGIPVAAAAVIATLLLAAWPDAHLRAAALTGSAWLAMDSSGAPTLAHLAREVSLDSLLLGYREATLFAPLAERLPLMQQSLDAPFWSLHLELYGSLLVLALSLHLTVSTAIGVLVLLGMAAASYSSTQYALVYTMAAPEMRGRATGLLSIFIGSSMLGHYHTGLLFERLGSARAMQVMTAESVAAMAVLAIVWWRAAAHHNL